MHTDVVVVGAGIAGLIAARTLKEAGISGLVLDKSRAVGGRMATRSIGTHRFDHGAQHFAARSPEVIELAQDWKTAGVLRKWFRAENGTDRLVGVGGMRRIPEFVAGPLEVRTAVTVQRLEVADHKVRVLTDRDTPVTAQAVVMTPPLPQLLALLMASGIKVPDPLARELDGIRYRACLAVMASMEGPSELPDGHLSPTSGPIAWIADNAHKGTSPAFSITIHSTPEFAESHLEADPDVWANSLVSAARPFVAGEVHAARGHRWRYAEPTTTLETGCAVLDEGAPIVLAGEVFMGARIEGAILSGLAAAHAIIERIG
jgi:predicted NAD/FAD-dependent oxidoreductase